MTQRINSFSAIETCIFAFQIWAAFFVTTLMVQVILPALAVSQFIILFAGAFAIALIYRRWIRFAYARRHLANLSLLTVGLIVGLDMVGALFEL